MMLCAVVPAKLGFTFINPISLKTRSTASVRVPTLPLRCSSDSLQQLDGVEEVIVCDPCRGKGWILCDFCNGQKTNVKSPTNRIYRRCPSCKAVGCVLCAKCKVFKCVTFPDYDDAKDSIL